MFLHSPPESVHALDLDAFRKPEITLWSAWEGKELVGCGALKEIDQGHGEVKTMRTVAAHLRKGVAARILEHIMGEAKKRGYRRLSLETGTQDAFAPARAMYMRFGFSACGPFEGYTDDPNSAYFTRAL